MSTLLSIPRIYQFSDFRIDTVDESLRRGGEKLSINRRTFQVLWLLVERAGEIVSKQEFFDTVWADTFVEDNSLTVAVTTLRKLLGDNPKQPRFIENLPRKGYRFIGEVRIVDDAPTIIGPQQGSESNNTADRRNSPLKTRKIFLLVFGVCLLFLAAALGFTYFGNSRFSGFLGNTKQIDSIAVLPFENQNPDIGYLSDGLTESVNNTLATLPNMRVIARDSVNKYRNAKSDAQNIGRELNVRAVLSGRVVQNGEQLTVIMELTDVQNGKQIWGRQYRRQLNDLFTLQQEIAGNIVETLRYRLTSEQQQRLERRETGSDDAYHLYLKGIYFWNKRTQDGFQKAVDFFRQAIEIDPTYAQAYVGLANSYAVVDADYIDSDQKRNTMVLAAAQKALDINPDLGEAYATQGLERSFFQWDWAGAEREYKLAIELRPNYATAHHWYAEMLAIEGRFDESFAEYDRALELDPLSLAIGSDLGITYYYAGQYDRALDYLQKLSKIDPTYGRTYTYLADVYRAKGMYEEAITNGFEKREDAGTERFQKQTARAITLRQALKSSGPRGYWQTIVQIDHEDGDPGAATALLYAGLGDREKAFECLEKAYAKHDGYLVYIKVRHEFDDIRSDPRFIDLVRRVGLPAVK